MSCRQPILFCTRNLLTLYGKYFKNFKILNYVDSDAMLKFDDEGKPRSKNPRYYWYTHVANREKNNDKEK